MGLEHTFERKWNSIWKMAEEKRAEDENENTREIHAKAAMAKVKRRNCVLCHFLYCSFFINDVRKEKKKRAFSFFFSFLSNVASTKERSLFSLFTLNSN